jgi:hypothetical protein
MNKICSNHISTMAPAERHLPSSVGATSKKKNKPISRVLYFFRGKSSHHLSLRPTPRGRTGRPSSRFRREFPVYMVLLPARFTWPTKSLLSPVGSYPTFSPLPRRIGAVWFLRHYLSKPVFPISPFVYKKCGTLCSPDFPLSAPKSNEVLANFSFNVDESDETVCFLQRYVLRGEQKPKFLRRQKLLFSKWEQSSSIHP